MPFQRFRIGSFLLTLNPSCYLVEVKQLDHPSSPEPDPHLPAWVFESKHTIWLMDENKPIHERARHGEEMRRRLLLSTSARKH